MNDADELELHRLCEHLEQIEHQFALSDVQREALRKAAFALHLTFLHDLRQQLEDHYASSPQPLTEEQRSHLRSLGIDPDTD